MLPILLQRSLSFQQRSLNPTSSFIARTSSFGFLILQMASSGASFHVADPTPEVVGEIDPVYPGTAVKRMIAVHERVKSLSSEQLNGEWESVRRNLLWAGGLKDLPNAAPGMGYTGHSFNDFNHCDLTTMLGHVSDSENEGRVQGIAQRNPLGNGIRIASIEELGPGGSWSTCLMGCNRDPPHDVAHIQFQSRIAFKLVWAPPTFTTFVLVDDDGNLLAKGTPSSGRLPHISERQRNYAAVQGGKYATAADQIS